MLPCDVNALPRWDRSTKPGVETCNLALQSGSDGGQEMLKVVLDSEVTTKRKASHDHE